MNHLSNTSKSFISDTGSTPDANKLYSILLDTRASSASETMYDIVERIMMNEKENSKSALEQLWSLKKNLDQEDEHSTIDLLINFYQEKMNVLRKKEEHIKKVSRDSRELLEEKRKRDSEIAMVKQEVTDCTEEMERLDIKLSELKVKEQELTLIEKQLQKELVVNANEVVNGLYEIILTSQEDSDGNFSLDRELSEEESAEVKIKEKEGIEDYNEVEETDDVEKTQVAHKEDIEEPAVFEPVDKKEAEVPEERHTVNEETDIIETDILERDIDLFGDHPTVLEKIKVEIVAPFPKSVVKTTRGIVIGEYYYDPKVYKNNRHYIYNSNFFRIHLFNLINSLKNRFDQSLNGEALQMVQDAYKRISEKPNLHFEISTNEILNKNTLKDLWQKVKIREYEDVLTTCNKLKAKIDALGNNYGVMLTEQMARYSGQ